MTGFLQGKHVFDRVQVHAKTMISSPTCSLVIVIVILCLPSLTALPKLSKGSSSECSKATDGQAKHAVEYENLKNDVCCIQEASKTRNVTAECCVPVGKSCSRKNKISCCNQLSCLPDGDATICKQRTETYVINKIKEDKKSCTDPKRPVRVLLELTIKARSDKAKHAYYNLKDLIYCCNVEFSGRSKIVGMEHHCCGTGFAICDDAIGLKYPAKLKCCGNPKQSQRESNCGAYTDPRFAKTIEQEEEQNRLFISRKTGRPLKEVTSVPLPAIDGYGFCHYVHAGRFDVTRDLSRNPGSDIFGLCKEGRTIDKVKDVNILSAKNAKCPRERKFMYQFQDDTNICCSKAGHLHDSDEEAIHKDCCINNFSLTLNPSYVNPLTKYGHDACSKLATLSCCGNAACKRKNKEDYRCSLRFNDTFIYCANDFLFDVSDADYVKASKN